MPDKRPKQVWGKRPHGIEYWETASGIPHESFLNCPTKQEN